MDVSRFLSEVLATFFLHALHLLRGGTMHTDQVLALLALNRIDYDFIALLAF